MNVASKGGFLVGKLYIVIYNTYMIEENNKRLGENTHMPLNRHEWRVISQRLNPDIWIPQKVHTALRVIKKRVIYTHQKSSKRI